MEKRLHKLFEEVGEALAGRPVKVILEEPPNYWASGPTLKSLTGECWIYINPEADVLATFLHECAHIRNGDFKHLPLTDVSKIRPGSQNRTMTEKQRAERRSLPREANANALAEAWLRFADRKYDRYDVGGRSILEQKLLALRDYYEVAVFKRLLTESVERSVIKALTRVK